MLDELDLSLPTLERALAARTPREYSRMTAPRRAAVAVLLRYRDGVPDVLLMRRAEHESDRWSGHVSFPGGREEDADPSLVATALRETQEEVGIDLAVTARHVGQLDAVRAIARGKLLPMSITPFVFVEQTPSETTLNHEVAETFWLPLDRASTGILDAPYPYRKGPLTIDLPSWKYEGRVVWGLTFDMLSNLLDILRARA